MNEIYYTIGTVWWKTLTMFGLSAILAYVLYSLIRGGVFSAFDHIAVLILSVVILAGVYKITSVLSPQGLSWNEQIQTKRSTTIPSVGALSDAEGEHAFSTYAMYQHWFDKEEIIRKRTNK